jgi:DNA helicase-2/ATP-dependent DNA helicase PcrA
MWQNDKTPEAAGRLENLKELVKALEDFENLQGFLEHVSLIMENESVEFEQKVSLMTLHAAKGLEFPVVFLPGWEDGLFPSQRSMDESGVIGLEEERRLAYVGITRSEQACYISFAGNRRVFGQWQSSMPSRFIDELPEEHVEVLTASGIYSDTSDFNIHSSNLETDAFQADGYDSPGWRRLQNNKKQATLSKPAESRSILVNSNAKSIYEIGERVFHQKFGYGMVIEIEGDKLQIEFEKAGSKRVVSKFVSRPEDIT